MRTVLYILSLLQPSSTTCTVNSDKVTCVTIEQHVEIKETGESWIDSMPKAWMVERGVTQSAVIEIKPLTIDEAGCRVYHHQWRVYREPCKI